MTKADLLGFMMLQTASLVNHLWLPPGDKKEITLVHPFQRRLREDTFLISQYAQALNISYLEECEYLTLVSGHRVLGTRTLGLRSSAVGFRREK
jgi:hypothetical protein